MAKGHSDQQHDQGTPTFIIMSVLFAIMVFALEGIKSTIMLTGIDYQTQSTILGFIGLGLSICFFWRRLQDSLFKSLTALVFTAGLWAYLLAMIALPVLTHGEDVASRMQLVHQGGLGAVVIAGFTLMAALLYHQKPVPALLMTTLAGFLAGLGSLYPLLNPGSVIIQEEQAIENRGRHAAKKLAIIEEEGHHSAASSHDPDEKAHERELMHDTDAKSGSQIKLLAHAAPHDEDLSEDNVHRALRHAAEKEHEEADHAPRTLTAAQKATLERREKPVRTPASAPKSSGKYAAAAAPKPKLALMAKAHDTHGAHWEYSGHYGPEQWGTIADGFKVCSAGLEQSPINILNTWSTRNAIELDYKPSTFQVIDNGHTVQVNVERGNFAKIAGQHYELKQFHFHAPSEHLLENRPYQMEVHFVHANDKGELAVIGAFINPGPTHAGYQTVWDYMPVKINEPIKPYNITLDMRRLLPTALTAFHYRGSLTTPPCSEKVNWNVLDANLKISQDQIDRFKTKYQLNARPVQPLNYRRP